MPDETPEKFEFRDWMDERGLKASEVAAELGIEDQTVRKWRSEGTPPRRRKHLSAYMEAWVPKNERREPVVSEADLEALRWGNSLVLRPTEEQHDAWNRAALAAKKTLKDWALDGLDELAGVKKSRVG